MIKLLCFLKRNRNLSREEFHRHWREKHGQLFASSPALRQHIVRYEQNHRLDADYLRDPESSDFNQQGFDGVTVIWYESMAAFQAMSSEADYLNHVVADEDYLLDRQATQWIIAGDEDIIIDKPGGRSSATAKLLCLLRRSTALEREHFHQHWLQHHGGLFQNEPNLYKDILAYDQNHRLESDYQLDENRNHDGVTEQWFESLERFYQSLQEPEQKTLVEPDVAYMLDPAGTHFIMSDLPEVIIDNSAR